MFEIEYRGGNTVVISTKKSTVVFDPKMSVHKGEKDVIINNAVEIATEDRFLTGSSDYLLNISYPGSYEVSDFSINGFAEKRHIDSSDQGKKAVVYNVEVAGAKIGVIGNVGPDISDDQLENIGLVDILILPVGGNGYTLDATSASKVARSIDSKVIIPVHYADDGVNYEVPQNELDLFVKEMGVEVERVRSFKLKSLAGLPEKTTIYHLDRIK